jgi:hypothetical protein
MATMKLRHDTITAQLHELPFLRFWNACASVVHQGLGFSRSVYRVAGTCAAGLANLANGSVLLTAVKTITVSCV